MLKAISRRINRKDEGFTLIELMVVLVVIGILMAIAIPTFLGAKNKASDKSAEENVRNALTAEKEYYTDNQSYTAGSLSSLEPSLSWVTAAATAIAGNPVFPTINTGGTNVMIQAPSASGGCVFIDDQATSGGTITPGTYYALTSAACGTAGNPGIPSAQPGTGKATAGNGWGASW